MEFSTQSIATPESANTAIHMEAIPHSPNTITAAFTANAKITFSFAIRLVAFAIRKLSTNEVRREFINTTSAASIAASAPLPMAAPISAPAKTGASLIPSPINPSHPGCSPPRYSHF